MKTSHVRKKRAIKMIEQNRDDWKAAHDHAVVAARVWLAQRDELRAELDRVREDRDRSGARLRDLQESSIKLLSPDGAKALDKELDRVRDLLRSHFCCVCFARHVLYKNGRWDCPDLSAEEIEKMGGRA